MASDKTPDDTTGDGVNSAELLARVHTFLTSLLAFLGFRAMPTETVSSMLETLTAWLKDASAIRRDPQGATAKIWWDAFKATWTSSTLNARASAIEADEAAAEFGKRFLPVADEEDRDTLNTADFDAMRDELDQADRYRQEICDAIDGREGERAFLHPRIIDAWRIERADLVAKLDSANHVAVSYANECDLLRKQLDTEKRLVAQQRSELATLRGYCDEIEREQQDCRIELAAAGIPDTGHTLRFDIEQLRAKFAGAIVPQPKPERVEHGQRWAMVSVVKDIFDNEERVIFSGGNPEAPRCDTLASSSYWVYLGTESA